MSRPFVAIVSHSEAFNAVAHARYDLFPVALRIRQSESQLAEAEIDVRRPDEGLSSLSGRRVLISMSEVLLFDGVLSAIPRGLVGDIVSIYAVAHPPKREHLEGQLAELADTLKASPHYDALFVPQGNEGEWSEILAGRTQVLTFSRIQGAPFLSDMTGGATHMNIRPLVGTVEYDAGPGVSKRFGIRLEARWKQLITQTLSDSGALWDFETMTPDGIIEDFPSRGTQVGDGFTVVESRAERKTRFGKPKTRTLEIEVGTDASELDPAFIEESQQKITMDIHELDLGLSLRYRTDVERTERAEFSVPVAIQPGAALQEEEWEELTLRDLTQGDSSRPWQPNYDYAVGDQVIDGIHVYRARVAHTSGRDRDAGNWIQQGEARYLSSRRISSFFKSDRGQAAIRHALRRVVARATAAARTVSVSFEAPMPRRPWKVTPDMTVGMTSDKLPGGAARGRLVEYELAWENGRRSFSGRIACTPGLGISGEAPVAGTVQGDTPTARGRMSIAVEMGADEQEERVNSMASGGLGGMEIPETIIRIRTTPVSSSHFEQEVSVPISGTITFEEQVGT